MFHSDRTPWLQVSVSSSITCAWATAGGRHRFGPSPCRSDFSQPVAGSTSARTISLLEGQGIAEGSVSRKYVSRVAGSAGRIVYSW